MCRGVLVSVLLIIMVGCQINKNENRLELSEDEAAATQQLISQLPAGTPIVHAKRLMAHNGFECSWKQDETGQYLYCDLKKPKEAFVGTRWQVVVRYENEAVTNIAVSTGYIGL